MNNLADFKYQLEIAEKTGVELLVILGAEKITDAETQRLKTYCSNGIFPDDNVKYYEYNISRPKFTGKTVEIPGVSYLVDHEKRYDVISQINKEFNYRGYYSFVSDKSYREDGKVTVSVVKGDDQYRILQLQQTNGANYSISNDRLISLLKEFEKKYAFDILGADFDWCELRLRQLPSDWIDLAEEVLTLCPSDEVTSQEFASALESDKGWVFLWWD